mgnify:CR=1 FL=1
MPDTMPEKSEYALLDFKKINNLESHQTIVFYKLNPDGSYENGTTLEEMLLVCMDRLTDLNTKLPCNENEQAFARIQEALFCLDKRTEDRMKRGVKGQHLA